MNCKYCGGEINLATNTCVICGREADDPSSFRTRIVRDVSDLAEQYGVTVEPENPETPEDIPELFAFEPRDDRRGNPKKDDNDGRMRTFTLPPSLAGLMEEAERAEREKQTQQAQLIPPMEFVPPAGSAAQPEEEPDDEDYPEFYRRIDKAIAPSADKILGVVQSKLPKMKRAKKTSLGERLLALGAVAVIIALIVFAGVSIARAISQSITGEWEVSRTGSGEVLTVEFTASHKVIVRAYEDGEEHIYRSGTYKVRKKNGHNMLFITYEDGEESRLYYEINGSTGTFTNVDSNKSATYTRIKRKEIEDQPQKR